MNFEELLQCPVCFELPNGAIQQCEQGHAVCQNCRRKLTNCPVCRGLFYGTRNYVMEELIEKMKRSNIKGETNNKSDVNNVNKIRRRAPPSASPGYYPCKISFCKASLPVCHTLVHLKNHHKEALCESSTQDGSTFTRVMDILWIPGLRQVFAMQISDMGLFYLIIHNDQFDGTLRAWVQMVAHHQVAQKFLYELNFHSENHALKTVFIDNVQSVKQPYARFLSTTATPMCTFIKRNSRIFNMQRECPYSRLHLAITFADIHGLTITRTHGTKFYKNYLRTDYPELKRHWKFDLASKDNLLQINQANTAVATSNDH